LHRVPGGAITLATRQAEKVTAWSPNPNFGDTSEYFE
jgi:hypothetical protein